MRYPTAAEVAAMTDRELCGLLGRADHEAGTDARAGRLVRRIEIELDERDMMEWEDPDTDNFEGGW